MDILNYIPIGKEKAITRQELADMTGINERTIRLQIKELVKSGIPILSSSSHKGYWYSNDVDEIGQFIKEYEHRRDTECRTIANLKRKYLLGQNIKLVEVRQHFRKINKNAVNENQITFI